MPIPTPDLDINIMPKPPELPMAAPVPPPLPKPPPQLREFGDALATRKLMYDNTLAAAQAIEPYEDDKHRIELHDVDWADPDRFPKSKRKQVLLTGQTLARRMRGTWRMFDKATGQLKGERSQYIGAVPYLSSMGTFLHRGNEYTVSHQQRLNPGIFARQKANGELESHLNFLPGKGVSHRYFLDPNTGLFKMRFAQSEMPLMPLLKAMGATDAEMRDAWHDDVHGDKVFRANFAKSDPSVLKKLQQKILRAADLAGGDNVSLDHKMVERFKAMEIDPEISRRTLGTPYARLDKDAMLAATRKLMHVNLGKAEADDRDHLANQTFFGPEDLFAERIKRDHAGIRRGTFKKISGLGSLDKMPSGLLTPQIEHVLLGSGLAQSLEEINPLEVFDKQSRITRMGEGGIPSMDSVPDEARSVQPSHMGFMDPSRTPESFRAGIDLNLAHGARKGNDGRIYQQLKDKSGNLVWKSPQDLADSVIANTDALAWDTKRVPVMRGGKQDYATRDEIDYVVPDFSNAFSPLAKMTPFMAATKPGRVSMGARYITQALGLRKGEAPYVQMGVRDDAEGRSNDMVYGKHAGALRADKGGQVLAAEDGGIKVRYDDGTEDDIDLYHNYPFNRKSFIHQTPTVKPGDTFKAGQLLAKSNFTDDTGAVALGINARVAYMPLEGYNFEDAQVISESAAKKFSSEHMYQHDLEVTPKHKVGMKSFVSLFPSKYDRKTLAKMDETGLIRVGETVEHGEPLILAAKEKDRSANKIHKARQPGYSDESVTWEHKDPGVVTDVVQGKNGPVVVVKSVHAAQVADKLSGRVGDKGTIAAILPDDQMPRDADGNPYEVLLSPDGTITRANPSQNIEGWLGKIAHKTGKPVIVPDFNDESSLVDWTRDQMAKHGVSPTSDVFWPKKNMTVKGIGDGYRYLMKLHHTSESKAQARDGGAYSADETPAKGGQTGCFTGDTRIVVHPSTTGQAETESASVAIRDIVKMRLRAKVGSASITKEGVVASKWDTVGDWFAYFVSPSDLITVTLENGQTFSCTKNHVLYAADGTKVFAGDIRPGTDLLEV